MIGTAAGAWLISVLVAHFRPSAAELVLFTAIFAWLSYAVLNVNYALFTLSLTGYIVFLLALASIPEDVIAHRRAVCTLIGGVLALAVRLLVIFRWRRRLRVRGRAEAWG